MDDKKKKEEKEKKPEPIRHIPEKPSNARLTEVLETFKTKIRRKGDD